MCADGVKPVSEKYLYSNAVSGMIRIGKDEGIQTFYKGLWPNVVRSVLMSEWYKDFGDYILTLIDVSQIVVHVFLTELNEQANVS